VSRFRSLVAGYRRRRFGLLFVSLLLTLGLHPLVDLVLPGVDPTAWLFALNLLAAVLSVELGRVRTRALVAVALGFVVLRLAHSALGVPVLLSLGQGLWMFALGVTVVVAVEHAFRPGHPTERLFAALDAYLLGGFTFGAAFWLLERHIPGSFGPAITSLSPVQAIYVSFFTLTTLGLGNVIPANGPAQGLMILEAIGGQMYLAVLVARLVSLYSSEDSKR